MTVVLGATIILGIGCLLAFTLASARLAAHADRAARPKPRRSN